MITVRIYLMPGVEPKDYLDFTYENGETVQERAGEVFHALSNQQPLVVPTANGDQAYVIPCHAVQYVNVTRWPDGSPDEEDDLLRRMPQGNDEPGGGVGDHPL